MLQRATLSHMLRLRWGCAVGLMVSLAFGCARPTSPPPGPALPGGAQKQSPSVGGGKTRASVTPNSALENATRTVGRLKLSQLVGQRIIYGYAGAEPPLRLKQLIARGEAGGIILFSRNIRNSPHLARAMRSLQAIARPAGLQAPLLVMVDQEGGHVKRLPGSPQHSAGALGRINSLALASKSGFNTGRSLRKSGINVNLAPVVDVARAGSHTERWARSYGRDAEQVGRFGQAFARGLLQARTAPCWKHFPGLGLARINEDLKLNTLAIPTSALRAIDEKPFRLASARGLVMTSTAIYPELDTGPAVFSRRVVQDELRRVVGFSGVSITDDLEVPALRSYGSSTRRGALSIKAGNDLLLFAQSLEQGEKALRGLTRMYEAGHLDRAQLLRSSARILAFRLALK